MSNEVSNNGAQNDMSNNGMIISESKTPLPAGVTLPACTASTARIGRSLT